MTGHEALMNSFFSERMKTMILFLLGKNRQPQEGPPIDVPDRCWGAGSEESRRPERNQTDCQCGLGAEVIVKTEYQYFR
jgi:hypothetical protein